MFCWHTSHHFLSTCMVLYSRWLTHSFGDDSLHGAGEAGRHAKSPVIQDVHGYFETSAHLSQQTVGWHANIIEINLSCVGRLDSHLLLWRTAEIMKIGGDGEEIKKEKIYHIREKKPEFVINVKKKKKS